MAFDPQNRSSLALEVLLSNQKGGSMVFAVKAFSFLRPNRYRGETSILRSAAVVFKGYLRVSELGEGQAMSTANNTLAKRKTPPLDQRKHQNINKNKRSSTKLKAGYIFPIAVKKFRLRSSKGTYCRLRPPHEIPAWVCQTITITPNGVFVSKGQKFKPKLP